MQKLSACATLNNLPIQVVYSEILSKISSHDQRIAELVFRVFREPCQMLRSRLAGALCCNEDIMKELSSRGIQACNLNNSNEIARFLTKATRCIKESNRSVPPAMRSSSRPEELVYTSDLEAIRSTLVYGEAFSLKNRVIAELPLVARDASIAALLALFGSMGGLVEIKAVSLVTGIADGIRGRIPMGLLAGTVVSFPDLIYAGAPLAINTVRRKIACVAMAFLEIMLIGPVAAATAGEDSVLITRNIINTFAVLAIARGIFERHVL